MSNANETAIRCEKCEGYGGIGRWDTCAACRGRGIALCEVCDREAVGRDGSGTLECADCRQDVVIEELTIHVTLPALRRASDWAWAAHTRTRLVTLYLGTARSRGVCPEPANDGGQVAS